MSSVRARAAAEEVIIHAVTHGPRCSFDIEIGCGGLVLDLIDRNRHQDHREVANLTWNTFHARKLILAR